MGKKSKRSTSPLLIISIIVIICSISLCVLLFYKKQSIIKEIDNINIEYNEKNTLLEEKQNELNELINKLSITDDIDTNISNMRQKYYSNIKTLEDKIIANESDKKIAYLTFDDGPYYLTHTILNILDQYDVLVTFFTIGNNKTTCYDNRNANCYLYNEEAKRGHTMANHTYSHGIKYGLYNSADSFITQVKKQEELIKNETGYKTNIVRFPGGSATAGRLKNPIIEKLRENGYGWVDWTASTGDGGSLSSADQAWNNFISTIDNKIEVILMHDYSGYTAQILGREIEYLKENGYYLAPLFYESSMINK